MAIDAQISEYLGELLLALPIFSLCASCSVRMLEWFRILCSVVFGWMLVLFVWALSMICLVMFVSIMSGWFLGSVGMFIIAVDRVKVCGDSDLEVISVRSCHVR